MVGSHVLTSDEDIIPTVAAMLLHDQPRDFAQTTFGTVASNRVTDFLRASITDAQRLIVVALTCLKVKAFGPLTTRGCGTQEIGPFFQDWRTNENRRRRGLGGLRLVKLLRSH